jgi:hypothetical protein
MDFAAQTCPSSPQTRLGTACHGDETSLPQRSWLTLCRSVRGSVNEAERVELQTAQVHPAAVIARL